MKQKSKILISVLTYPKYYPIFDRVIKSVKHLIVPNGYKIKIVVFVDTSNKITDSFKKSVEDNAVDCLVLKIDMSGFVSHFDKNYLFNNLDWTEEQMYFVAQKRNGVLDYARQNNYDWMLNIDGDILIPEDAIVKLLEANKKCISGWTYQKKGIQEYGLSRIVSPDKIEWGEIYQTIFVGTYCLLEHKDLFDIKYSFFGGDKIGLNTAEDKKRNCDVRTAGYQIYCHPDVYCRHLYANGKVKE